MTITFDFYTREPVITEIVSIPSKLPIGTFVYHQGRWAKVIYRTKPKSRFSTGVKDWELVAEHQVPKDLRLKALLLDQANLME